MATDYVFHAYATKNLGSVNAAGRDMFVRRVHWAADGMPVFDMSSSEELASKTVSVTVKVVDDTVTVDEDRLVQGARVRQAAARVRLHRRLVEGVRRSVGLRREGLCRRERFGKGSSTTQPPR